MANCPLDYCDFKFDIQEVDVDDFFRATRAEEWQLENYVRWCQAKEENPKLNSIVQKYTANLLKIRNCKEVDKALQSYVGRLIKKLDIEGKNKENEIINIGGVAVNNGNVTINNYYKKQKVDHTAEMDSWAVDSEEDVLDAWSQYLEKESHKHAYCLENYHVIECGYSIKCNPGIPQELYDHMGVSGSGVGESPFMSSTYVAKILEVMKTGNWRQVERTVICSDDLKKESPKKEVDSIEEYFRFCVLLLRRSGLCEEMKLSEANFNRLLVHPAIEVSISCLQDLLRFIPGERLLKSCEDKYNCDGLVVEMKNGNELFLLETSGRLDLEQKWKYGYDHIKCTFGALSLFNSAFKKYFFASKDTAIRLKIPYLHAIENGLHLWVLELCSDKLYISNKIIKCTVPTKMQDTQDVLMLGNLLWELKVSIY